MYGLWKRIFPRSRSKLKVQLIRHVRSQYSPWTRPSNAEDRDLRNIHNIMADYACSDFGTVGTWVPALHIWRYAFIWRHVHAHILLTVWYHSFCLHVAYSLNLKKSYAKRDAHVYPTRSYRFERRTHICQPRVHFDLCAYHKLKTIVRKTHKAEWTSTTRDRACHQHICMRTYILMHKVWQQNAQHHRESATCQLGTNWPNELRLMCGCVDSVHLKTWPPTAEAHWCFGSVGIAFGANPLINTSMWGSVASSGASGRLGLGR